VIEQADEVLGDRMDVRSVMIETATAHSGMLVHEFFQACGHAQVQALPYLNEAGRVIGRVTLKNVLRLSCLPQHVVDLAPMLNPRMSCVDSAEDKAREILCCPIEPFVQGMHETIPSDAPLIKALALMEKHDTSYIFVVDNQLYRGTVTIQGIAASMSQLAVCVSTRPLAAE
jgi:CBS-domain-containing membrane protein